MFALDIITLYMCWFKRNFIPRYIVLSTGASTINITKTTPEKDQIEICKAVKQIESEIKEYMKKKRELDVECQSKSPDS